MNDTVTTDYIDVNLIDANPHQPRKAFGVQPLEELANSIDAEGLQQAIIVRPLGDGRFQLIAGERRLRAVRDILKQPRIRAEIRNASDDQSVVVALIENLQREDLTAVEEADAIARALEVLDISADALAKRLGKSRSHVANMARIARLADDTKHVAAQYGLGSNFAQAVLRAPKDRQTAVAEHIGGKKLTLDAANRYIDKLIRDTGESGTDPDMAARARSRKRPDTEETEFPLLIIAKSGSESRKLAGQLREQGFKVHVGRHALKKVRDMDAQEAAAEETKEAAA